MYNDLKKRYEERELGRCEIISINLLAANGKAIEQLKAELEKLKSQLKKKTEKDDEKQKLKFEKEISMLGLEVKQLKSEKRKAESQAKDAANALDFLEQVSYVDSLLISPALFHQSNPSRSR